MGIQRRGEGSLMDPVHVYPCIVFNSVAKPHAQQYEQSIQGLVLIIGRELFAILPTAVCSLVRRWAHEQPTYHGG